MFESDLTAACCPKRDFYNPSALQRKCNRLLYCALFISAGCHKVAKLTPKGGKLAAKVCTARSNFLNIILNQIKQLKADFEVMTPAKSNIENNSTIADMNV